MSGFNWSREAEQLWNGHSANWHARSMDMWENGSRKEIIPFFEKHLSPPAEVLDIGCGDGYGSMKLAQHGYSVTGVDFSSEMISIAKGSGEMDNLSFIMGDVMNLPLKENAADALMVINCLEWTDDPRQAVHELGRVLKPGGYACIGILGPTAGPRVKSYPRLNSEPSVCNTMMPWEFVRLAEENNLKPLAEHHVYKDGVTSGLTGSLSFELRQALSFLTLFMLQNEKGRK
ncbi:class I SAM-dependent methyltransferase [Metabacillus sp. 84]|uniref:class I SAM-dependent methyltransferase n=1 Tax=unclassified Metabacillus TaxID=2675274 RepID=UPI003CF13F1B